MTEPDPNISIVPQGQDKVAVCIDGKYVTTLTLNQLEYAGYKLVGMVQVSRIVEGENRLLVNFHDLLQRIKEECPDG